MRSSSLFLGTTTILSALFLSPSCVSAQTTTTPAYALATSYSGSTFFDGFDFFSDADPTNGFVTYVDETTAQDTGLISASDGNPVYIGTDYTNIYNGTVGRPTVRIESKAQFNHALIITDLTNMPGGVCGTWPALWTTGTGEINIIENVNDVTNVKTTLHTLGQCNVPDSTAQAGETGTLTNTNCTYDPVTGKGDEGCGVFSTDDYSFGGKFNSINGGV